MTYSQPTLRLVLALFVSGVPCVASAQPGSPACLAVMHASEKMYATPNHQYMTKIAPSTGGTAKKAESITVGGVMYVMTRDKWIRSPVTPAMMADAQKSTPHPKIQCRELRSESVNGVAATVYSVHDDTDSGIVDGQYWIARGTGLLLRSELDIGAGGDVGKSHSSMRAEYTGVQAPVIKP